MTALVPGPEEQCDPTAMVDRPDWWHKMSALIDQWSDAPRTFAPDALEDGGEVRRVCNAFFRASPVLNFQPLLDRAVPALKLGWVCISYMEGGAPVSVQDDDLYDAIVVGAPDVAPLVRVDSFLGRNYLVVRLADFDKLPVIVDGLVKIRGLRIVMGGEPHGTVLWTGVDEFAPEKGRVWPPYSLEAAERELIRQNAARLGQDKFGYAPRWCVWGESSFDAAFMPWSYVTEEGKAWCARIRTAKGLPELADVSRLLPGGDLEEDASHLFSVTNVDALARKHALFHRAAGTWSAFTPTGVTTAEVLDIAPFEKAAP